MAYDKYIKIHNNGNANRGNNNSGIQSVNKYNDNDKKTELTWEQRRDLDGNRAQGSVDFLDSYAENDMKTINPENFQHLVSVVNSGSRESFVDDCIAAEKLYHSTKTERLNEGARTVEAYHIISSCKGTDIDPVLVHKAGCDLAKALAGDEFAAKICTHLNTCNYHNHIIINAYSNDGSHKFKDEHHLYKKIRTISNEISLRYGFEIIMEGQTNKKNWSEYLDGKDGWTEEKSKHNSFKKDIRECMKNATSYNDFESEMEALGYTLSHSGDRTVYSKEGYVVSDFSLGTRYTQEYIEGEIEKRETKEIQKKLARQTASVSKNYTQKESFDNVYISPYDEYGVRRSLLVRFLLLIKKYMELMADKYFSEAVREAFPDNARVQSAAQKIKSLDNVLSTLEKYDISTLKGLDDVLKATGMEGSIADHKATALFETADRMDEAVQLLRMEDKLSAYVHSLGITDEQFRVPTYSKEEIRSAYAALEPVTGDQKRRLFNALSDSDFRIMSGSFSALTRQEADKILDFLNGKTEECPDELVTSEEYLMRSTKKSLEKKAISRAKKMREKYHGAPISLKQKNALLKKGYTGNLDNLRKDKAMYLLNYLGVSPLTVAGKFPEAANIITVKRPCSDWQLKTLEQLKLLHPEDFDGIELNRLYYDIADRTISHYLAKYNVGSIYEDEEKKEKPKKIDFDSYDKETQAALIQYRKLLDYKEKFDLKGDKKTAFLEKYDKTLSEASECAKLSSDCNAKYKELNAASRLLKNCTTKSFVYGVLYGGDDADLELAKARYQNDRLGRLTELSAEISEAIERLSSRDIRNFNSITSVRFEPIDQQTYKLLSELSEIDPDILKSDVTCPLRYYNVPDALETLRHVQTIRLIERLTKEEEEKKTAKENAENSEENSTEQTAQQEENRSRSETKEEKSKLMDENTENIGKSEEKSKEEKEEKEKEQREEDQKNRTKNAR